MKCCTELFFTTKRSGSGIGLALCKEVAEQAGGELVVESGPGRGTLVQLTIPNAGHPTAGGSRPPRPRP